MKTYKDGSNVTIAEPDVRWQNTFLSVAVELGDIRFDSHYYELYNEKGENLHKVKKNCERLGIEFDKGIQGKVDMIRTDFADIYKKAGRDLFFEMLDRGLRLKPDMGHFINKRKKAESNKIVRDPNTLVVLLKAKWYDMIARGEKKEEYRDTNKEFWKRRLYNPDGSLRQYKKIRFQRGYTNATLECKFEGTYLGYGNPDWGAPDGKVVFCIRIGDRIL